MHRLVRSLAGFRSPPSLPWAKAHRLQETGYAFLLLAPSILLFSAFAFYPLVKTFYLGFFRSDPFGQHTSFVGLDQYLDVLGSAAFHDSLWVTFLYAVFTVPSPVEALLAVTAQREEEGAPDPALLGEHLANPRLDLRHVRHPFSSS